MSEQRKQIEAVRDGALKKFLRSEFFFNYRHNVSAIIGTVIVVLILLIAVFGPLFAPQDPYDVAGLSLIDSYKPPAWLEGGDARFLLGTDSQGRDMLSLLIYGSRISLFIGVVGTLLACAVGITLGLIAGYFGGKVDAVIMRLADILLSFPDILIALFIMTMFGRGVDKLLIVFTILGCVSYIRTVRAEVLSVKQIEYVDAARVIGLPNPLIMLRHVLPNVATTIIVLSTMKVGGLILSEATLSFLGVGVPVTEPSLGMLVKNGFDVLFSGYWWIAVLPGVYIMLLVFGINLLGDFLRDEFNPKLK
ncbi:ABC transporter permease [Flavonifractor sp. HCP28S3_F3]|uniref:ABC transporter permease n=1 Tax=Flavonifractor sp. HCP28S3_F3 TaxID=3438939 RepID=UPI003F889E91